MSGIPLEHHTVLEDMVLHTGWGKGREREVNIKTAPNRTTVMVGLSETSFLLIKFKKTRLHILCLLILQTVFFFGYSKKNWTSCINSALPLHGMARFSGAHFWGISTVFSTWYFFFSTTSTEVPSELYHYQKCDV